ncbi:uncharacterized protein LOC103317814 isoform X4 [Nasonia vitripennis]|uniref:CIDE-N domain-containing protein n=1 Tax=Nasonia vitripennis TaxID=7425 RepID=A0A7M7QRA8_NASVI|nr:uncharacterized protein LOC103317814 isoform X4 [Nasonia vitripennis]
MAMILPIKVCIRDRLRRLAVIVQENSTTLVRDVISAASAKFKIDGKSLVLEEDGVDLDNDLLVIEWKNKLFMVLQENENWSPINNPPTESNSSFQENKSLNVETDCSKKKCTTSESDTSDAPEQKRSKMSQTTD